MEESCWCSVLSSPRGGVGVVFFWNIPLSCGDLRLTSNCLEGGGSILHAARKVSADQCYYNSRLYNNIDSSTIPPFSLQGKGYLYEWLSLCSAQVRCAIKKLLAQRNKRFRSNGGAPISRNQTLRKLHDGLLKYRGSHFDSKIIG